MEISFTKLFSVLLKKWYFILAIALIVALFAYSGLLLLHNDSYTATATVLLTPSASSDNTSLNSNTTTALQNIITTYIQFFKEEAILDSARAAYPQEYERSYLRSYLIANPSATQEQAEAAFLQEHPQSVAMTYTNSAIQNATQVTQKGDAESLIFTIRVTLSKSQDAIAVANTLAAQSEQIKTYIPSCEGRIVTPAATANPNGSNSIQYALIAFVGGAFLSYLGFFLYELFNLTIRTKQDLKETVNLPIFGKIPLIADEVAQKEKPQDNEKEKSNDKQNLPENAEQILVRESYFALRAKLMHALSDFEKRHILFTSTLASENKSKTVANTAISFAKSGKKVLLIDADFYHSAQKDIFAITNEVGLSNLLAQKANLKSAIVSTDYENLDVILSGALPPNPAELLMRDEMDTLLEELDAQYDYIFMDAPPAYMIQDAAVLAPKSSGIVLIVSANMTKRNALLEVVESMQSAGGNVLGMIWKESIAAQAYTQRFGNYSDYMQYYDETNPFCFISEQA